MLVDFSGRPILRELSLSLDHWSQVVALLLCGMGSSRQTGQSETFLQRDFCAVSSCEQKSTRSHPFFVVPVRSKNHIIVGFMMLKRCDNDNFITLYCWINHIIVGFALVLVVIRHCHAQEWCWVSSLLLFLDFLAASNDLDLRLDLGCGRGSMIERWLGFHPPSFACIDKLPGNWAADLWISWIQVPQSERYVKNGIFRVWTWGDNLTLNQIVVKSPAFETLLGFWGIHLGFFCVPRASAALGARLDRLGSISKSWPQDFSLSPERWCHGSGLLLSPYIWKDPPFLKGKPSISLVIFHSYVSLPEGTYKTGSFLG